VSPSEPPPLLVLYIRGVPSSRRKKRKKREREREKVPLQKGNQCKRKRVADPSMRATLAFPYEIWVFT
jgi:hypothetical protein